jgi:cytochrome d ubiquinol oxidase subunit II
MLNIIWFVLLTVLMIGYAVLDGFDLGVGILHLFTRKSEDRRVLLNAIGPVWDGNEVWLITFGGALFAAFRVAYATVFSMFYTAFMMLLCALIFRAAAIEFRNKVESRVWMAVWDFVFSLGSTVAALLFGVAMGNVARGLLLKDLVYQGTFFDFLNPFSILVGLLVVVLFAMHGALYLRVKGGEELAAKAHGWAAFLFKAFVALYLVVAAYAVVAIPGTRASVAAWICWLISLGAIYNLHVRIQHGTPLVALISSGAAIASLVLVLAGRLFPNLVVSSIAPASNLTIYNAACSPLTLKIMLGIVLVMLPIILAYTTFVYWVFRGEVKLDKFSY